MNQLINLFRAVPDVIWSAVLASLLTLSGVLISNRSNTTRQRIQLQHDADQKAKERNAALRREVYLKLAEELTQANSYLARLPQVDASKANPAEGMQGFFAAAARLQLVAEPKTALLVNELVGSYGELLLRLISRSMPLQAARQKITLHDDLYSRAEEQVTRVLGEMVKFNESAQANKQVFCALQRSFEGFQTQASEHADRRADAWEAFNRLNIQFHTQVISELRGIVEQQIPAMVEIRRDLGLTTDLDAYREQLERNWRRMSSQFDAFLQELQND